MLASQQILAGRRDEMLKGMLIMFYQFIALIHDLLETDSQLVEYPGCLHLVQKTRSGDGRRGREWLHTSLRKNIHTTIASFESKRTRRLILVMSNFTIDSGKIERGDSFWFKLHNLM